MIIGEKRTKAEEILGKLNFAQIQLLVGEFHKLTFNSSKPFIVDGCCCYSVKVNYLNNKRKIEHREAIVKIAFDYENLNILATLEIIDEHSRNKH